MVERMSKLNISLVSLGLSDCFLNSLLNKMTITMGLLMYLHGLQFSESVKRCPPKVK